MECIKTLLLVFLLKNVTFDLLDEVINHKIDKVIITYKDRLSRVGFGLFEHLFENFGTNCYFRNRF